MRTCNRHIRSCPLWNFQRYFGRLAWMKILMHFLTFTVQYLTASPNLEARFKRCDLPTFFNTKRETKKWGKSYLLWDVNTDLQFLIQYGLWISHYHHNVDLAGSAGYCRNKIGSWEIPFSEFQTIEEKKFNIPIFLQRVVESTPRLFISSYDQPHLICFLA